MNNVRKVFGLDLRMLKDENIEQYLWRIGQLKDSGVIDYSWDELAVIINKETGNDDTPLGSSAYRKAYQQAKRFYNAGVFNSLTEDEYISELKSQMQELEKQKVKVRDERNELRRVIREEARKESYKEQILRSISEYECTPLLYDESKQFNGVLRTDNDLIISFYDVHAGINVDSFYNKFNEDVLRDRMNQYLDKIFEIQLRHGSKNAYIILSELISGFIHNTIRIENNQDIIEQFLMVTDYLSQFLAELSYRFETINVYVSMGNHSRLSQNKDDNLRGENMDLLAIPYLSAKLQNFNNIMFHENDTESTIAMFNVRGQLIYGVHGDRDNLNNMVQKLTMFTGQKPDIIFCGHRHTNSMTTSYDTKILQAGTLAGGGDEYCLDKRLRNKPEQIIAVITNDGLDCIYDVKFE